MSSHKVLMIGLDGATFDLLDPLIRDGYMPFLGKLITEGYKARLLSTPVPLTPPGWISTVTGVSPEVHEIHDFLRPEKTESGVYLKFNDSRHIKVDTVWTLASKEGKTITSLNFYGMSPPPDINGYLMSGFIPWRHLRSGSSPSSLIDEIQSHTDVDIKKLGMDIGEEKKCIQGMPEDEYDEWISMQSERDESWTEVLEYLMDKDPTDLTAIVYDGTDKIQHLFWRYLDPNLVEESTKDAWHQQVRSRCLDYYRQIDSSIERLVSRIDENTNVVFTSDHGFGPTDEVVYINEWLAREGYLHWTDQAALDNTTKLTADRIKDHTLMIDWTKTKAFALTPSSNAIYINHSEDGSSGIPTSQYSQLVKEISRKLLDYRCPEDGGQVFVKAVPNEKRLEGVECARHSPDIILGLRDGGFVSILRSSQVVRKRDVIDGTHRPDGIFIAWGPDIKAGEASSPFSIYDVTPTILYLLNARIPDYVEGSVATAAIKDTRLEHLPISFSQVNISSQDSTDVSEDISDEEKAALMDQLKLLGYME